MSRYVRPDTVTLPLSQGDSIVVKKRLNTGETRAAYARVYYTTLEGEVKAHPLQSGMAMVVAYLVDWTLTDDEGVPVPIKGLSPEELEQAINQFDYDTFIEIRQAIVAHEAAQLTEREQEKKVPAGVNGSAAISPSPSAAAGPSIGYAPSTPTITN